MTSRVFALALLLAVSAAASAQGTPPATPDSARAVIQQRTEVLGVGDAPASQVFEALPNGGRIELQLASEDSAGAGALRNRLRAIVRAFSSGDVDSPAESRLLSAPGARVMIDRRNAIRYDYRMIPRGAALRISTSDATARRAIAEFIAFQRNENLAAGGP